jgi:hypothetical protein
MLSQCRVVTIGGVWVGCLDLLTTCIHHLELHVITVHWHTQCPQSITVSTSRFLATDLTQWKFFSCRGHAVAPWLTLHTSTHSSIFSASPCRAQLRTPELDWLFSIKLFFITTLYGPNIKHRFQQYPHCCVFTDPLDTAVLLLFCACSFPQDSVYLAIT